MKLTEKAAYIKGFMEGIKFDDSSSDANKLLVKLTEIVCDMARDIEALEEKTDKTNDYVEELDYDLGELEELADLAGLSDRADDDDCSCGCDCDEDDYCCCEDGDEDLYEIECPKCHDKIYASEEMISDSLKCPNCNESIADITTED